MLNYAELRKFLAQDKLAKLIEALHTATSRLDADLNNQVVTIAGRLTRVTSQLNTGQISHVEANQERSRISAALLDIINQLEANYPATRQQPEPQQSQRRVRPVAQPQQNRSTWPYVLAGVVGCIIVLAIIGNLANSDGSSSSLPPSTSFQEPSNSNTGTSASPPKSGGSATKLTDERPEPVERPISSGYSASDLVGTWQTAFGESGIQAVAQIRYNSDGSYQSQLSLNGEFVNSEIGTWQLSGSTLHQVSPNNGSTSSSLTWFNRNQFSATDADEGIALVFSRIQ